MSERSPSNPYAALGVAPVINAAGKMTALGGTAQSAAVAEAQARAARVHVDLDALRRAAGARIAAITGAEAASVTTGAASGIAIAVAAILTGEDLEAVRSIPDFDGPNRVLLQAGHDVNFGADVTQMIRLGGGRARIVGTADRVTQADVESAVGPDVAALMFVQSHHCVQENRVALDTMIAIAHRHGKPLLLDAAAEADLTRYVAAGADLVTYSGGKAIGGPTSGFVAGRRALVAACELQQRGIARTMKVGKEQIMGLIAALEAYVAGESSTGVMQALCRGLATLPDIAVSVEPDRAGRQIERVGIRSDRVDLEALVEHLRNGDPSIRTRNHQLAQGLVLLDPRELTPAHVPVIVARIQAFLHG